MWKNKILREEADENPQGSGDSGVYGKPAKPESVETLPPEDNDDVVQPEGVEGADETSQPSQASKPNTVSLDPETIRMLREQMPAQTSPDQNQQQRQFSKEEIRQKLMERIQPVQVTPETLEQLGFVEPTEQQVKAFQTLLNQSNNQAVNTAKIMLEMQERKFQETLSPMQQYHEQLRQQENQRQAQEAEKSFYSEFNALQQYKPVVQAVAQRISEVDANGNPKTVKAIFKEVADNTVLALKEMGIEVQNVNQPATRSTAQRSQPVQSNVPNMASATRPGRSQVPNNSQANPDAAIYGKA